ncbi:3'(2'),5'-bisphosphate nucleotidase CysQ [Orrella marina]|nr:3'(2'),5'-bisphosphate nucleotidase CysQ [Orrella marina]
MRMSWVYDVIQLARRAGEETLVFHPKHNVANKAPTPMDVRSKSDNSPVTLADLAANRMIVQGLRAMTPDIPVVSEELPESEALRCSAIQFWLVDPLDGTREFVSGGDDFTVNIALIDHGVPVWGVVYAPVIDLMYWGGIQTGSFRQKGGKTISLRVRSLAKRHSAGQVLRVVASKSHLNSATRIFLEKLGDGVELLQAGSSLKFCLIAQADADLYPRLGDTCEWDTAAAQAVLEGAGGVVCDLAGNRLVYGKPVVLNPHFIAAASHPQHWLSGWDALRINL